MKKGGFFMNESGSTNKQSVPIETKNQSWSTFISKALAKMLVQIGDAVPPKSQDHSYLLTHSHKEIFKIVQKRDKFRCRCCHAHTHFVLFVIPETGGGLPTSLNGILCCPRCKEQVESLQPEERLEWAQPFLKENEPTFKETPIKDGSYTILSYSGKNKTIIPTTFARKLLKDKQVVSKGDRTLQFFHWKCSLFFFTRHLLSSPTYFLLSESGKWSEVLPEEEIKQLEKENLAFKRSDGHYQMKITISTFKENILARDKKTCQFCGKYGGGVYSSSTIKTYANSSCICLDCEYQKDPDKFLDWLNIQQCNPFMKKACSFMVKEKHSEREFHIYPDTFRLLLQENMATSLSWRKIELNYTIKEFRKFILKRDDGICFYCGKKGDTIDHKFPKSKGGVTTPDNCVCCCRECNEHKGNLEQNTFAKRKK